jgi:predicted transposase YbfD/YdcC
VRHAVELRKHGGRLERRELWTTNRCNAFLDWPGVKQVCRIQRTVRQGQTVREETAFAITSLSWGRVTPKQLLRIWREHWGIENRSHYVRDVTFGEDACRVRTGAAPQLLAGLRNLIISYLHVRHAKNLAAAIRNLSWQARKAAQLVGVQGVA